MSTPFTLGLSRLLTGRCFDQSPFRPVLESRQGPVPVPSLLDFLSSVTLFRSESIRS